MKLSKKLLIATFLVLNISSMGYANNKSQFEQGVEAYQKGDYQTDLTPKS